MTEKIHYLDQIAAALPDAFKEAIRADNPDEAHILKNERVFGALWEAFDPEMRHAYYRRADMDQAAITAADPRRNANGEAPIRS